MAFTNTDEKEIERIVRREIKSFSQSSQLQNDVIKILQKELGTKNIDDKIVDLASKVVVELFRTLWQRKSFWENPIKSIR